jgi:glycine betaine catabolism B
MAVTHPARLVRVVDETPKDRTLVFELPPEAHAAFAFEPGQYVTFRDVLDDKPVVRSYSISSAPSQRGSFDITVRNVGRYGERLFALPVGAVLAAQPPRGGFVLDTAPGRTLLLCAGGSGVTPYRGFLRTLIERRHADPVAVLHSVREPGELIFRAEFEAAARAHPWFRYVPTVTRLPDGVPWTGRRGRLDVALLDSLAPDRSRALVYACGPNELVDGLLALAREAGFPPENLRREKWG